MSHIFIGIIAPSTILIPIGVALYNYARMPLTLRYIFFYLVISACINLVAILLSYQSINNLPLLHLLTLFELFFLLYYFSLLFERKISIALKYVCWGSLLFCLANALWWQSIFSFNSYARGLEAIIIILVSLLYFVQVPERQKTSWEIFIVSGLLLYYAGSFFLYLFSNFLKKGYGLSTLVWNVNAALVIILYILITVGILKCNRQMIISTSSS
ncbi:MAG: hypothetical protein Q8941_24590 [Bacteroidota bacterium]|nr:hypothetical protein [Bacteroidota bacterium]